MSNDHIPPTNINLHLDPLTVNVNHMISVDRVLFAILNSINHGVKKIMASQDEVAATLAAVQAKLDAVSVEVDKVGVETDTLVKAVADLTAQIGQAGGSTPAVDAALAAVQASADALAAKVQAVDDKVADAA